jgi:hypothetical protein
MSVAITPWPRPLFQPGGKPGVFHLFCFSPGALEAPAPLAAARFGLPSPEAAACCEVRQLPRAADAGWFDGFRRGALRELARAALPDLAALDAATAVTVIITSRPDAADLAHLQAAWALAQWSVARGATVVFDAQASRFWPAAEVADWPATRPFALSSDVNVIVEAEGTSALASAVHTRGLAKFGRPDLVTLDVPASRWDAVAGLLRTLAGRLVLGAVLRPGDALAIEGGTAHFAAYAPDRLNLGNDALLVTGTPG